MNRPFNAFGALAAMLALAMFAVSSTSRSTTTRRPSLRTRGAIAEQRAKQNAAAEVARLTLVMTDGKASGRYKPHRGNHWSYEESLTTASSASLPSLGKPRISTRSSLRPAQVTEAEWTFVLPQSSNSVSLQLHYDFLFDDSVAGVKRHRQPQSASWDYDDSAADAASEAVDQVSLFLDVLSGGQRQPVSANAEPRSPGRRPSRKAASRQLPAPAPVFTVPSGSIRQLHLVLLGAKVRLAHECRSLLPALPNDIDFLAADDQPLSWPEYAELIEAAAAPPPAATLPGANEDATAAVRSGFGLLHSAASSVHQLGLLLLQLAGEIERLDREPIGHSLSTQSP